VKGVEKMEQHTIAALLATHIAPSQIKQDEPMKKHTTFRIGGVADFYVTPTQISEVVALTQLCKTHQIPLTIVGNGSNLLVSDKGIRGVVVEIGKGLSRITVEGEMLTAEAGVLMSRLGQTALSHSLTGMECGHGIPGTLGGAVVMNAGAYGWELKDVLVSATVLTPQGEVITLSNSELGLGYRTSCIKKENYVVLSATLRLQQGDKTAISAQMKDYQQRRKDKQPLEFPSAGSTFKRPEGYFAGKLIMDSGLRGYQVGGARVSDKHCGFVINTGDATCEDVKTLMREVARIVYEKFGVHLEPEVKMLGE
jgi:UDP-N-acetylmuramate dehydrogenase